MSFIMDLPPDVETRLQAEASRQGVPVSDVALRLALENLPERTAPEESAPRLPLPKGTAKNLQMSVEEWEAQFDAWTGSPNPAIPALDPESLRRCNMYEAKISRIGTTGFLTLHVQVKTSCVISLRAILRLLACFAVTSLSQKFAG